MWHILSYEFLFFFLKPNSSSGSKNIVNDGWCLLFFYFFLCKVEYFFLCLWSTESVNFNHASEFIFNSWESWLAGVVLVEFVINLMGLLQRVSCVPLRVREYHLIDLQAWLQTFSTASPWSVCCSFPEWPWVAASSGHAASADLGDRDRLTPTTGDMLSSWLLLWLFLTLTSGSGIVVSS
jgi:hypothetical protein